MRTAFPILAFIPVILLIAFGFIIFACPPCSGENDRLMAWRAAYLRDRILQMDSGHMTAQGSIPFRMKMNR